MLGFTLRRRTRTRIRRRIDLFLQEVEATERKASELLAKSEFIEQTSLVGTPIHFFKYIIC